MPDLSLHHFGKTTVGFCHHSILARSCANGTEPVWLLPKCQYFGWLLYALSFFIVELSALTKLHRQRSGNE
jgi:hypothetical protein